MTEDLDEQLKQILEIAKTAYWEGFKTGAAMPLSNLATNAFVEKMWDESGVKNGFIEFLVETKVGGGQ